MGVLRSEEMKHGTLVLPADHARHYLNLVGGNCNMQFEDMNAKEMRRPYKKFVQRLDECERILRFLSEELSKLQTGGTTAVVSDRIENFLDHDSEYKLDDVEAALKRLYRDFLQFDNNAAKILEKRTAALEELYVIQTAIATLVDMPGSRDDEDEEPSATQPLLGNRPASAFEMMFSNIAGVIPLEDQDRFARALHRQTRGNAYAHFRPIPEPMQDCKTGKEVHKSVFVIYFQDSRLESAMAAKVNKVCSVFALDMYNWPKCRSAADQRRSELQREVEDAERLLKGTEALIQHEVDVLLDPVRDGVGNSLIEEWRMFCLKEKALYNTLNMFEGNMNLRASCWYPAAEEEHIRVLLVRESGRNHAFSGAMLVPDRQLPHTAPPTYIVKNELTCVFQDLVDTYGLPRYGEANPALFTLVTFPFLFAIMFGDIGHGSLLLMTGLWAIVYAEDLKRAVPILYKARYILSMMGFFAVYVGFIYNDFFSIGLNLFGSRWTHGSHSGEVTVMEPAYDITNSGGAGPYPFGIDPAWHGSTNQLIFMNSLKMKISVIFGVTQMFVGLLLRFSNAVYEGNAVDFFCECCPMMVFMLCFFGFMDLMILYKWVTPMPNPPSIINSMIAMGMWQPDDAAMFGIGPVRVLMVLTMVTIPVMLFPKPLLLIMRHKSQSNHNDGGSGSSGDEENIVHTKVVVDDHEAEGHHNPGEIVIHQIIETIEYVLGTVSHTASYLRLWALSLAHQQLSMVFFQKTLLAGMMVPYPWNIPAMFVMFALWFGITLAVLMGMDVLECFLHTLRLHWVEFQSKFYRADGYAFVPYKHRDLLEAPRD
eukprot:TRINITY_DN8739_c0_g3_i1.p1 TRINITY_DN8739_c0_g3~~TRINITY_DN8739_c0_g3_i1.p1  ORF type:complete len:843 (+),score=166.31 TRINITY_DN8739_c0_g3_i1:72-2531(+)